MKTVFYYRLFHIGTGAWDEDCPNKLVPMTHAEAGYANLQIDILLKSFLYKWGVAHVWSDGYNKGVYIALFPGIADTLIKEYFEQGRESDRRNEKVDGPR